jgi:hypothetical protein
MNSFEMVIGIVLITSVASVIRAKYGVGRRGHGHSAEDVYIGPPQDTAEAEQLRGEVRQLKDRIQVLERIVTDSDRNRGLALEEEIELLRDRKPIRREEIE